MMRAIASFAAVLIAAAHLASVVQHQAFLGRWNLTGLAPDTNYVYWLEVKEENGQLTGMFLNRTSSPVQLATVKVENGELIFQLRARGDRPAPEFRARLDGDKLVGSHTERDRTIKWVGVRPPRWPAVNSNARHAYGTPIELFDGKSIDAFGVQNPDRPINWMVEDGLMTNTPPANNLLSKEKFKDFRIQAEYKLSAGQQRRHLHPRPV